mmetsp:Transcript_29485/g.61545  ORF Transcript_29485/g.61545 Transcript_29485/m.61545 type:complete len:1057 (+) Transcript_29485:226-3396(+)
MLRVTPIYGSSLATTKNSKDGTDDPLEWISSPTPSCTLVEYAGMKLLLNAGWDETLPLDGNSNKIREGGIQGNKPEEATAIPDDLPDVDAVLITDSTLSSLGGLPLYFGASKNKKRGRSPRSLSALHSNNKQSNEFDGQKKKKRNPPFLATYPTVKMGQMTMYDHHASLSLDGTNPGYTLEDVDAVFSNRSFCTLKYSQTVYFPLGDDDAFAEEDEKDEDGDEIMRMRKQQSSKINSKTSDKLLAITPHLSGHVVGGCYWVLKQLSDDTEVILAPTYHHAKEKHLAGSTLHKFGVNADALMTMPGGPRGLLGKLYQPPPPKTDTTSSIIHYNKGKSILSPPVGSRSEAEMIESVMAALRRDGNVLLPVDASGRVLELLLVLDRHWERQRLGGAYNLCWVGPMASNTIEFARSQLEWMAEPLGAQFDSQRGHPYSLKSVRICSSVAELESVIEASNGNPTAVLASGASLDHGPARDLLLKWGDNPDNLVLITNSTRCVPRGNVWFSREDPPSNKIDSRANLIASDEGETDEDGKLLGAALSSPEISSYTTASQLLYQWCAAKAAGEEMADVVNVDAYVPHRAPLAGAELKEFLAEEEAERRERKAEAEKKAMLQEIELARGQLRLGDDDAVGGGAASKSGTAVTSNKLSSGKTTSTSGSTTRPKKKSKFDQSLFIKFSKPVHMTFEVREEAVGIGQPDSVAKYGIGESVGRSGEVLEDDYGIAVKAESFVDIVTGVDPSKFAGGTGRIGEEVLRRGLGFGSDGKPVVAKNTMRGGDNNESALIEDEDGGITEKMLEISDLSSGKGIIKGRNGRPPIKVSTIPRRLEVLAEVSYIPIEGRVDARAARQSVRALQPRHLIVIGGPKSSGLMLSGALQAAGSSNANREKGVSTHIPRDGETVKLTVGHAAYSVRIIDTPYLSQEEKDKIVLAGKEIEPVEPREEKIGDCSVSLVDFVATGKKWAVDGSLVLAPRFSQRSLKQPSLMLSTREVLLTDLRAEVAALGMKAEYSALSGYSQLTVNGKIFVRKDNVTGKIDVEGPLCEDFYLVRSVVCDQYVTL